MSKASKEELPISHSIAEEIITIRDCLRWATSRFLEADLFYGHGTDNAWDEAIHLVLQELFLPLDIDDRILDARLTFSERTKIIEWVYRRVVGRIPLPYLTHVSWFADHKFYVDKRVIIPRSPIGELIRNNYEPWVNVDEVHSVLDLCTGSGCIGIASSYVFEDATITLSDLSLDAVEVAQRNVKDHKLKKRIKVVKSDLFTEFSGEHFDLIVSNPPYVNKDDFLSMPSEFKHEPKMALESGLDGLDIVRRILKQAPHHLNANGKLIVEVGNSKPALEALYPNVPFTWLDFQDGGDGVFLLTAEQLLKFHETFVKG
ncbi:MAG: ribosomal protein L3 glutamine methyltransferase [Francisellaceae bacterium]|jgi:ribosomal protein L3 glutamine methyltransferase